MQPLVTVIVPFFNAGRYFGPCVRSILGQTYPHIEFIFVDDGSTDDSLEQLKGLLENDFRDRKDRVTLLEHENQGPCKARAAGLERATGDYILCLDADDWIEPDMVERLVTAAQEEGSDFVYCDFYKEYADRTRIGKEAEYPSIEGLLTDLIRGRRFHGYLWNKLIRRDLYMNSTPFKPVINLREDLILVFQMAFYARKIVHLPVPLYHYRKDNGASILHQDKRVQTRKCAATQLQTYDFFRNRERPNPVSAIHDIFLLQTLWYVFKTRSWDLFDQYPYLQEEGGRLHICSGMLYHPGRYFRIKNALRKRGKLSGRTA